MNGTMEEAIREALEYYNKYAEMELQHEGKHLKVRVVALYHDSMGNKLDEPFYTWHDYTEGTFARDTWKDEPTLMIIG